MTVPMYSFARSDVETGNLPSDKDYDFCRKHGIMTVEAQQRNAALLDRQDAARRDGSDWFKNSSAFTGD